MSKPSILVLCLFFFAAGCRPEEQFRQQLQPETTTTPVKHNSHPGHITSSILNRDGNIVACGSEGANGMLWVISRNTGHIVFSRSYPSSEFGSFLEIEEKNSGGYMICGSKISDSGDTDIHMTSVTADGDLVWHKSVGGLQDEINMSMTRAASGQFVVVAAQKNSTHDLFDMWMTESGSEWHLVFEEPGEQVPYCATKSADGGILITGTDNDNIVSRSKFYLMKFGPTLDTVFRVSKQVNNTHTIARNSIELSGGSVVSCGSRATEGKVIGFICKTSNAGIVEWDREYSGDTNMIISKLVADDQGFKAIGYIYGNCEDCNSRSLLISLDAQGNEQWRKICEPEAGSEEMAENFFPGTDGMLLQNSSNKNGAYYFFIQRVDKEGKVTD